MNEEWRPAVGFAGHYDVSSHGRIRSKDHACRTRNRWGEMTRRFAGKLLSPSATVDGYLQATLMLNGSRHQRHVHALVAEAFIGARPAGMSVCHRDDDKMNNRLSNLYYGSPRDNYKDAERNGRAAFGDRCGSARLTAADISKMISLAGFRTHAEIAAVFGVHRAYVSRILRAEQWKHVPRPEGGVMRCAPGRHHRRALGM